MPIYRMSEPGKFQLFAPTQFHDFESKLEDWIERNPHLLFPDETVVFIGRQTTTAFGKQLDLLGLDESGATVVIELKRGMTPRDVVAQTLEYAAWVDSLELDELDTIATAYVARRGASVNGVLDLYRGAFEAHDEEAEESLEAASRVTFNARQRLVIVAESFSPELEQTLHYLRTKLGIDVAGIRFGIHQLDDDTLVETETIVGRELRAAAANKSAAPSAPESPEQTRTRVVSEFVRDQVEQFEGWVTATGGPNVEVRHLAGSTCTVYEGGRRLFTYYFALHWLHFEFPAPSDDERATVRQLDPSKVVSDKEGWVTFNVVIPSDLELVRPLLARRLGTQ